MAGMRAWQTIWSRRTSDLLWAGDSLLAELGQTPTYRLLDHEGSLAVATDASGNVLGANVLTPYGQAMNEQLSDAYTWAGLFQDTEYSGQAAWYRDYSARAARWLTPAPYNGSYNTYRPQSYNRYMYVMGDPLGDIDPSGEAGAGILTGIGGGTCSQLGMTYGVGVGDHITFNPCDPFASVISMFVDAKIASYSQGVMAGSEGTAAAMGSLSRNEVAGVSAAVSAVIRIACSIARDLSQTLCGPKVWTSMLPGVYGKIVGDSIASVGGILGGLCATGTACPAFIGYLVYQGTANLLAELGLFNGPQFTGSLLPRPTDLGGLGSAPIGIPNGNLTVKMLLGQSRPGFVPSPGSMGR